uniref:Uncharacterized protein n=1 Tax=viral metagenome TaxID=1070528 RepID=A0A6H1ZQA4_9ZZZZ
MTDYYGEGTLITGGGTTLTTLKTTCKYHGWSDTSTAGEVALTRFINDTLYILSTLAPWPEYMKRDGTFNTATDTDEYTLDETNISRVGVVERASSTLPFEEMSIEDWQYLKRTVGATGTPDSYAIEKGLFGGTSTVKMLLYPYPTAVEAIYYTYGRKPTVMSEGADVADWPSVRTWLFNDALEYLLSAKKGDVVGYSLHNADFMQKVYKALGDSRGSYLPIKVRYPKSTGDVRIRDRAWSITS